MRVEHNMDSMLEVAGRVDSVLIKQGEVSHLKAWSNYTFINWGSKTLLSSKTLGHYFSLLDDQIFIRTHRSYCVNVQHIEKVNFRTRVITLHSGEEIPLARSKKRYFRKVLADRVKVV